MDTKQLTKEAPKQTGKAASGKRPAFCLRLNTLRAFSCLGVIVTHILTFIDQKTPPFKSLHFAGHMAVYLFFNLSGYLLSLSLAKEVRRRLYENTGSPIIPKDEGGRLLNQISLEVEDPNESQASPAVQNKEKSNLSGPSIPSLLQKIKRSTLVSILGKFLWNRTWKTFPMYYGAWFILKAFAHEGTTVEALNPNIKWSDIFGLKAFPGHLWTMRIDMIFYFFVTPVYICILYVAFKLQKEGFKKISKGVFGAIIGSLIGTAIYNMCWQTTTMHPSTKEDHFVANLPPFCFGMIAGLLNFALERKFNTRNPANAQESQEEEVEIQSEDSSSFKAQVKSFFLRNKCSIIYTLVFLRVLALNPGVYSFFFPWNPAPSWQIANRNSYWYGVLIFINDSRGGFWKYMHQNEPQEITLRPTLLDKTIYYFGLWSYAIYLTHVISFDLIARILPERSVMTVDFWAASILVAFGFGIVVDYVFDKIVTEKVILGKFIPYLCKLGKKQKEDMKKGLAS